VARVPGKFQALLVKFSAAESSPVSQPWADLLACEHLALETLREQGIPVARTELLDAAGRRFLEVERFDRVLGVGRRSVLSLGTLEDALVSATSADWVGAGGGGQAHFAKDASDSGGEPKKGAAMCRASGVKGIAWNAESEIQNLSSGCQCRWRR